MTSGYSGYTGRDNLERDSSQGRSFVMRPRKPSVKYPFVKTNTTLWCQKCCNIAIITFRPAENSSVTFIESPSCNWDSAVVVEFQCYVTQIHVTVEN